MSFVFNLNVHRAAATRKGTQMVAMTLGMAEIAASNGNLTESDVLAMFRDMREKFHVPLKAAPILAGLEFQEGDMYEEPHSPTRDAPDEKKCSPEDLQNQPRHRKAFALISLWICTSDLASSRRSAASQHLGRMHCDHLAVRPRELSPAVFVDESDTLTAASVSS
jgi:hypothetical protein